MSVGLDIEVVSTHPKLREEDLPPRGAGFYIKVRVLLSSHGPDFVLHEEVHGPFPTCGHCEYLIQVATDKIGLELGLREDYDDERPEFNVPKVVWREAAEEFANDLANYGLLKAAMPSDIKAAIKQIEGQSYEEVKASIERLEAEEGLSFSIREDEGLPDFSSLRRLPESN